MVLDNQPQVRKINNGKPSVRRNLREEPVNSKMSRYVIYSKFMRRKRYAKRIRPPIRLLSETDSEIHGCQKKDRIETLYNLT